jgi:hypothetical protein
MIGILTALARRTRGADARHLGTFLTPAETHYVKGNVPSKALRYETAIEWQTYRAQDELELRRPSRLPGLWTSRSQGAGAARELEQEPFEVTAPFSKITKQSQTSGYSLCS